MRCRAACGCRIVCVLFALHVLVLLPCAIPSVWMRVHRCTGAAHRWQGAPHLGSAHLGAPPSVAVVVVLDDFMSADMRARTIANKRAYAEYWNYSLVAPSVAEVRELAHGFPTAWAKLDVARRALESHAYVFVVDGDAVIMRADVDLGRGIAEMEALGASLMISKDFNGLNSGVFLVKNSSWGFEFLAEASAARASLGRQTRTIPLKYENRAFFYLTDMWPECFGLRRLDALLAPRYTKSAKFQSGVYVVDRCLINRRPEKSTQLAELLASDAGFDHAAAAFVMHVPGGDARSKRAAMEVLLRQSELGAPPAGRNIAALQAL